MPDQKEQVEKLREYIAKEIYDEHFKIDHEMDKDSVWGQGWKSSELKCFALADALLSKLPIPLYLKTGEITDDELLDGYAEGENIADDHGGLRGVVLAVQAKFVDIREVK